jgi:hypothetical protein
MNYQAVRAKLEMPILSAFNSQLPEIPVYFDNIVAVPPSTPKEYVSVNIMFGLITKPSITGSFDYVRGSIIVRCYAEPAKGAARCQEMIALAKDVLDRITAQPKKEIGVHLKVSNMTGPMFFPNEEKTHFVARLDAGWQATVA